MASALALLAVFLWSFGARAAENPELALAIPPVSLTVEIDGHYRERLNDPLCQNACGALRSALQDSVRQVFAESYPFLRWQLGPAPDTVEVRWSNRPPNLYLRSQLEFRIRGRQPWMRHSAWIRKFEEYPDFERRDLAGWRPDALSREWLKKLRDATDVDQDLLVEVVGRIPHVVGVTFPNPGTAIVAITDETLKAAAETRPAFDVVTRVTDPLKNSSDSADIKLTGCTRTPERTFTCDIVELKYASKTVADDALVTLLQRATITPQVVRLIEYRAAKSSAPRLPAGIP